MPNPQAYNYWKFISNWKDIGELDYYIFPVNYSKLIFNNSTLSFLSLSLSLIISYFFKIVHIFSNNIKKRNIFIHFDELSRKQRFNLEDYLHIKLNNKSRGYYRIYNEKGLNVAYIIHINFLSKKNISTMINKIIFENGSKIDLVAYIGNLNNKPFNLIKLPNYKYPRKLVFTGLILENLKSSQDIDFFDLKNWEVNLANFDNR